MWLSPGVVAQSVGEKLTWGIEQRQFQAERSTNETVDRLVGRSGKS